ncbi:thioredoxin family protein [Aureivirga sp. CE67]|uniref:thioredoxin family protein n=1 Tax=Aureivirga sp. CE67 TaxID=1788983 RepID=UPI0018CBDB72|nr:thioredoxin family protein [Aureivirga sp. CE67]
MRKLALLIFSTFLFVNCGAPKKTIDTSTLEKNEKGQFVAIKNEKGSLVGVTNKEKLTQPPYSVWFNRTFDRYKTEKETMKSLNENTSDITMEIFMGTWCSDSRREVPRFYKVLDEMNYDLTNAELIMVDYEKETYDNLQKDKNIIRVPTFIIYENGKEIGRIVETPQESLEEDLNKILQKEPYTPSVVD